MLAVLHAYTQSCSFTQLLATIPHCPTLITKNVMCVDLQEEIIATDSQLNFNGTSSLIILCILPSIQKHCWIIKNLYSLPVHAVLLHYLNINKPSHYS